MHIFCNYEILNYKMSSLLIFCCSSSSSSRLDLCWAVGFFTWLLPGEFLCEFGFCLAALIYCDGLFEGLLLLMVLGGLDCEAGEGLLVVTCGSS